MKQETITGQVYLIPPKLAWATLPSALLLCFSERTVAAFLPVSPPRKPQVF